MADCRKNPLPHGSLDACRVTQRSSIPGNCLLQVGLSLFAESGFPRDYSVESLLRIRSGIVHNLFRPTLQFRARKSHAYRRDFERHLLPFFGSWLIESEANSPPATLLHQIT